MATELRIITDVLIEKLDRQQLHEILEGITARIDDGYCPLCGAEEIPVNGEGEVIESDDVSMATEWREQHDRNCPVTLIEKALQTTHKKGKAE